MPGDDLGAGAERSVEARVQELEERVQTLESLLRVRERPTPSPTRAPFPSPGKAPAWAEAQAAAAPRWSERDLEELLGGRLLAWVGGVAIVLAAVFFLVMAVHNGWIGERTRVGLAFLASSALVAAGAWLQERKGQTQAARALLSAGIAAEYASAAAATALYHVLPATGGLVVAGIVGAAATVAAIRWSAPIVAGIGIVGALLAPVLVDAGSSTASLAFMAVALLAAVGVLLWRRFGWLSVAAYVTAAPQAGAWLYDERNTHLVLGLVVVAAFWAVFVAATLGYELRAESASSLRALNLGVLLVNSAAAGWAGGLLLLHRHHGDGATAWIFALGLAHVLLAVLAHRARLRVEAVGLLAGLGGAFVAVGLARALDGPALVAGWSTEAVVAAGIARRGRSQLAYLGAGAALLLAAGHTVRFEARPRGLAYHLPSLPDAVIAVALVVAAAWAVSSLLRPTVDDEREAARTLRALGAGAVLYGASLVVVQLAGPSSDRVAQTPQLALSAFWAAVGAGLLVVGLARGWRVLRLGGFVLLAIAAVKVFLVDLAQLESVWRVGSFLLLGLLLLGAAYAYQRIGRKELHR